MEQIKETKNKLPHILILLAGIIFILPFLFSMPLYDEGSVWARWFSFAGKGEIGDTIGGITAPFINGLAAVLVYIAFKEQNKANKIISDMETEKFLFERYKMLREDIKEFPQLVLDLQNNNDRQSECFIALNSMRAVLNKMSFFIKSLNNLKDVNKNELLFDLKITYSFFLLPQKEKLEAISNLRSYNEKELNMIMKIFEEQKTILFPETSEINEQ